MRQKIDIAEVESATKIRAKYLRALENEEWDLLPGPTFVKSFLRTYAEALDLDWVRDAKVVGLTAGASAPEELVLDVIAALRKVAPVEVTQMNGIEENIVFRLPPELRHADGELDGVQA